MTLRFDRRTLLGGAFAAGAASCPAIALAARNGELVYIGMHGGTIRAARFNATTGDIALIGPVAENSRPTWGVRHPTLPLIYFNEEAGNDGQAQGGVLAYRLKAGDGSLTKVSDVRAGGGGTTHLWLDMPSRTLFAVNYGGGNLVTIAVAKDGSLGAVTSVTAFKGSGPSKRQASPHPHGVSVDPSGKWILVTDLGADRIWVLPFKRAEAAAGPYDPLDAAHYVMPAGSGPRHMAWHPVLPILYVVEELTAHVDAFRWDASTGRLVLLQSMSTDDPSFAGVKSAAEVAVSRDGRFVYTSNRGDHSIVVHAVDKATGQLTRIQRLSSGGPWPWHFAIHATGKWMLVANRDANGVTVFSVDRRTGLIAPTGKVLATPSPVHILFAGR